MTEDQFALLQDKVTLWGNASVSGAMELRDYNGRAREALATALVERAGLLKALKELHLKTVVGTDDERHAALNAAWEIIARAEPQT